MSLYDQLWVERYRPKNLEDLVLSEDNRKFFSGISEDTPHLLLHGKNGTGKTTLAKIVVNDILKCQHLYINASDENGVDTIRNKVVSFAQTSSLDGKKKIIVLDECLEENTLVTVLRDGSIKNIPIKDLQDNNDLVKSYNIKKNRIEWKPFILLDKGEQEVYEIDFENNEKIVCTGDHKWYVEFKGEVVKMKLKDIIKNGIKNILNVPQNVVL